MDAQRTLCALFCDDIRQEIGGKITLIGVYASKLILGKIPSALHKLHVLFNVDTPIGQPFGALTLQVLMGDDVIAETAFSEEMLEGQKALIDNNSTDDNRMISVRVAMMISPLVIERPEKLRTAALLEDGVVIHGPALKIEEHRPPQSEAVAP